MGITLEYNIKLEEKYSKILGILHFNYCSFFLFLKNIEMLGQFSFTENFFFFEGNYNSGTVRKQGESVHVILEFTSDKEGNTGIVRYDTNL